MSKKGITLVELIVAISLLGFVFIAGTNLVLMGMRTHAGTAVELEVQANIRLMSGAVNNQIRDASGVYLLNKDYPSESQKNNLHYHFTDGWNYLMLNSDQTALVEWVWDGSTHQERSVATAHEGITYNLYFKQQDSSHDNRLLKYFLTAHVDGREIEIVSEVESVNTLQVVDRSYGKVANTLAYRDDPRVGDVGVASAAVSFVMDVSGSMDYALTADKTRLQVLKEEANKMVDAFSEHENIYLSLSPFSFTANSNNPSIHRMLPVKNNKETFINLINGLEAGGGTNTGDGMRRGYHSIKEFSQKEENQNKLVNNFMIILVDGARNMSSISGINAGVEKFSSPRPHTNPDGTHSFDGKRRSNYLYRQPIWWIFDDTYTRSTPYPHEHNGKVYVGRQGNEYVYGPYVEHNPALQPTLIPDFDNVTNFRYYIHNNMYYGHISGRRYYEVTPEFVKHNNNIGEPSNNIWNFSINDTYPQGRAVVEFPDAYVREIGTMIQEFKNTRNDSVKVYVIGFGPDALNSELEFISEAVGGERNHQTNERFFRADSQEALERVLEDIQFEISDSLWHIGGPN